MHKLVMDTPLGELEIVGFDSGICEINFLHNASSELHVQSDNPTLLKAKEQLEEYFDGKRKQFTFPLVSEGTPFQNKVWTALKSIPFGETWSYKDICVLIGKPKAYRAVGGANNKNKLPIVIPCHRVIGSKGELTGYAGGLASKEWLLEHERSFK